MRNTLKLTMFLLFLILLGIPSVNSGTTLTILSSGKISYPMPIPPEDATWVPSNAQLLIQEDFSTTKVHVVSDAQFTEWTIDHYMGARYIDYFQFDTNIYHSSPRSFKIPWAMQTGPAYGHKSWRPSCKIYLYGKEVWWESWYYLPQDFELVKWLTFSEPLTYDYQTSSERIYPYENIFSNIMLSTNDLEIITQVENQIWVDESNVIREHYIDYRTGIHVPRGEWFRLRGHTVHSLDENVGLVDVWYKPEFGVEQKILEYRGKTESYRSDSTGEWGIIPFDHYKAWELGLEPYVEIYFDDLRVWVN